MIRWNSSRHLDRFFDRLGKAIRLVLDENHVISELGCASEFWVAASSRGNRRKINTLPPIVLLSQKLNYIETQF